MKCTIITLGMIFCTLSQNLLAQNWTAEEQGLIDHIKMAWDAWEEAIEKNDPDIWYNKVRPAEDYSMWWTEESFPQGYSGLKRDWESVLERNPKWIDLRPVAVRIYDNVGMVQFYGYWKINTKDGPVTSEKMRTEIFIKRNGHWTWIGGQGSPITAKN